MDKIFEKKYINLYSIFTNAILLGVSVGMIYMKEYFGIFLLILYLFILILTYKNIQIDDKYLYFTFCFLSIFFGFMVGFSSILLNFGKSLILIVLLITCFFAEIFSIFLAMLILKDQYFIL